MITVELLADIPLLKTLNAEALNELASLGADVFVQRGEWLIRQGEVPAFFILLSGALDVFRSRYSDQTVVNHYGPGDFFGEVPMLLGTTAIAGVRATEPSRVARWEEAGLRLLMQETPIADRILAVMNLRISRIRDLIREEPPRRVTVVGFHWDRSCHELRTFLARNHVRAQWMEPDGAVPRLGLPKEAFDNCPVVVMPDGRRMEAPSYRQVADLVGLSTVPSKTRYDVVVVGGGPAGLAAAVYGASEGLETLLVEREAPGGQAGTSSRIANYLGFPAGLSGDELATRAYDQAINFGCDIVVARQIIDLRPGFGGAPHQVVLDGGDVLESATVVLSMGVTWRRLDLENVDALVGRGIFYGSSPTDAIEARGQDVFLVGGGNSAGQAATYLSNFARSVTVLVRGPSLAASMSTYLIEQMGRKTNITVKVNSIVTAVEGSNHLQALTWRDKSTGVETREAVETLFLLIGAVAPTEWLPSNVLRDDAGYVCTGRDLLDLAGGAQVWPLTRDPYLLETSVPGIFAAGDVRHGSIKRVASGVGEGSMAIAFIHRYREVTARPDLQLEKAAALATIGSSHRPAEGQAAAVRI